ncbi:MAG: hypothetical protein KDI82_00795 [Gammaproteobacteria bacterium]|nr:hypothetical protein [Gammaproteobacteria bacterium]
MFGLGRRESLIDEQQLDWMFAVFAWALRNFDPLMFRDETQLVTPTNAHFPGRADNADDMARLIFERVVDYAGMRHWPLGLVPPGSCAIPAVGNIRLAGPERGGRATAITATSTPVSAALTISYDPDQLNNPEAMIAVFAHTLAHYLGSSANEPPPGGAEHWPQTTEVLAVFLGFGLMFANTALVLPRGGCCGGPVVRRAASVTQHDITYALALFAALKQLPQKDVLTHLKKSLRGHFKRALRELQDQHGARLQELRDLMGSTQVISKRTGAESVA